MIRRGPGAGFTLIEVLLAVLILAPAVAVLVGLQGAAAAGTMRARDRQDAVLLTRRLLSFVELRERSQDVPEVAVEGSLIEVFDAVSGGKPIEIERRLADRFTASFRNVVWPVPLLPPVGSWQFRRVTVEMRWGPGAGDVLATHYFFGKDSS